ncbi:unnamed protein product [Miscanthus lutarioriparius]|uniref:HAT C-terminal dimerisation domain-containing protein n=1 Tax=Miscanthus lutarioriparius TaxID=422564 RepID=A0A811NLM5_9POAL|nr:unnamed protein product [Miscanthus lutarioriparius]
MSVQQCAPQTETGVTSREEVNVLKRNSDDVGWEYGFLVDANNKDKVEGKFCGHRSQGGVHRLKEHVANVGTNAGRAHRRLKTNQAVNTELDKFRNREGPFNKKLAKTCEKFEYNPASWWRLYGTETPALQKLATRILSLTSSSSGCERNWSTFEMIHTKKRNRLTTTRLNKLVFIQFNSKLLNKKERIASKKTTDVLLSSETTEAQGFLYEDGDDCAIVVYRDEEDEEMEGTGITWSVIGEAVGADQQLELRRSARVRQLYEGEEFDSEEEEFDEDEDEYMEPY